MAAQPSFADSVFLNCPFDPVYMPLLEALVFCVIDCGFVPRCALEGGDAGATRIDRIEGLVASCAFSVHDLSRVELSEGLPRFNMPFELGLDLGCRRFGSQTARPKQCLVVDSDRYRYQRSLSDISGQDIRSHRNSPDELITSVRNWLRTASGRSTIPGPLLIKRRFRKFSRALRTLCDKAGRDRKKLEFADYTTLIEGWLRAESDRPQAAP